MTRRIKILVHHRIASRDGQAVHIEELVEALSAHGHEVVVVGPNLKRISFGGSLALVERVKAALPAAIYELLELAYNVPALLRLRKAVRAQKPEKPDIIYERFSLFLLAGVWVRRIYGIPILLEVNGPLFEERGKNDGLALHHVAQQCQTRIWNSVDYVLPVTHVLSSMIQRYGVPEDRVVVIPNGVNQRRFGALPDTASAKAALGLTGRLVLGFTGFARQWHALERVIDFVALHGERFDMHYLLVGDGPARESLIAHARAKQVEHRVTITGVVERDEIPHYIAAFDIALQPGVTAYASPLKLFEYMYLKRAIVAPAMDNIREILTHGHDALLFVPEEEGAMEDALLRMCNDEALRVRLGQQARMTIEKRGLTWSDNAQQIVRIATRAILREAR